MQSRELVPTVRRNNRLAAHFVAEGSFHRLWKGGGAFSLITGFS